MIDKKGGGQKSFSRTDPVRLCRKGSIAELCVGRKVHIQLTVSVD